MKNLKTIALAFLIFFATSCNKDDEATPKDKIINGVNVNSATETFNSFRTKGISGFPSVAPVTWNDTLSNAAYNFAKAKTEDINTPSNPYTLSNGQLILDFPSILNYSRSANFAFFYAYPANADVTTVINAGFATNEQIALSKFMNSSARQFGMGQFGDKWYIMMSN